MRDDPDFNIKFCEVVQTFPCLYDNTRSDYSNRASQDQAWKKVGEELKERAADCKDRWKNIRGRYVKCKNQNNHPSGSGVKKLNTYYLTPHLHFLDTFVKSRESKGNIVETPPSAEEHQPVHESFDMQEEDENEDTEHRLPDDRYVDEKYFPPQKILVVDLTCNVSNPTSSRASSSDDGYRKRTRVATMGDVNCQPMKYFEIKEKLLDKKHTTPKSEAVDTDLAFLQCLLPDMKAMDERKKRRFKIEVLQLADKMLDTASGEASASRTTFEGSLPNPNVEPEQGNEGQRNYVRL